ncbi:HK97-gp10 family putative phage morphogenesis protein [Micromonospora haikouensis]|uniref:HK97-gp10 family putative phage morphogenesis protein n=1 Tax=Micromonospora haikouensis TaxID=686309 RepID=UPI00367FB8B1
MASVSVDGGGAELAAIEAQFHTAGKRITEKGSRVVRRSTLAGESVAKQLAAVDTGFMRSSVSHEFSDDGLEGEWGPEASYAKFVERGTSRMAPQPFVGPSLDAVTPGFIAACEAISDPLD